MEGKTSSAEMITLLLMLYIGKIKLYGKTLRNEDFYLSYYCKQYLIVPIQSPFYTSKEKITRRTTTSERNKYLQVVASFR